MITFSSIPWSVSRAQEDRSHGALVLKLLQLFDQCENLFLLTTRGCAKVHSAATSNTKGLQQWLQIKHMKALVRAQRKAHDASIERCFLNQKCQQPFQICQCRTADCSDCHPPLLSRGDKTSLIVMWEGITVKDFNNQGCLCQKHIYSNLQFVKCVELLFRIVLFKYSITVSKYTISFQRLAFFPVKLCSSGHTVHHVTIITLCH